MMDSLNVFPTAPSPRARRSAGPTARTSAVWVSPNIEHFHFDEPFPGGRSTAPDVPSYAVRDYGNRVAVWRMMKTLDRYAIRASVMLNAEVCKSEPEIIREGTSLGWEWLGHGLTNSQPLAGMDAELEEKTIMETLSIIEESSGTRPKGWLGPVFEETSRTPDLLNRRCHDMWPIGRTTISRTPCQPRTAICIRFRTPWSSTTSVCSSGWVCRYATSRKMITDQFDTLYAERRGQRPGHVHRAAPISHRCALSNQVSGRSAGLHQPPRAHLVGDRSEDHRGVPGAVPRASRAGHR